MRRLLGLAASLALACAAQAQVWTEIGDAPSGPPVPGQITVGVGPLTTILGGLGASGDVDMYCVRVTDPGAFGAIVAAAPFDSQLFMFDLGGMGVNHNDDNIGLLSGLYSLGPVFGAPPPIPLVAGAEYGLAIASYDNDPLAAGGGYMWSDTPYGDQTSPELSPGPLGGWDGSGFGSGAYEIHLVGATFCEVPEPASLSLLALSALFVIRRR